jgi:hypothetical protein
MSETVYEMYPQRACFVCGRKMPIDFMGTIESKHYACPEHYNEIIATYGINATIDIINKDNDIIKNCYNFFTGFINKVAKYEKQQDKDYLSLVLTKHKELIALKGKDIKDITIVENKDIVKDLDLWFTKNIAIKHITTEELITVRLNKSYYPNYYYALTGRSKKERGIDKWLL